MKKLLANKTDMSTPFSKRRNGIEFKMCNVLTGKATLKNEKKPQ